MSEENNTGTTLFMYNPVMAHKAGDICFLPTEEMVNPARPLRSILELLSTPFPKFSCFFADHSRSEALYYMAMQSRQILPHYFPAHDICLLAANMLRQQLHKNEELVLLDWEMLPTALLFAKYETSIFLPPAPLEQEEDAALLATFLQQHLPYREWILPTNTHQPLPKGCLVLGQHPLRHGEQDPRFLERLQTIHGGVLYTGWDFLGVKLHAHTRSLWIKNGLIQSVIQLPRPRRQSAMIYPALLQLRSPVKNHPIHLARIASCGVGPSAIKQEVAMSLLHKTSTDKNECLTVSTDTLARDGLFDLSPIAHLAKQKTSEFRNGLTLRHCAHVLRCQLPRERVNEEEHIILQDQASNEDWLGECHDGTFLCREVGISELDQLTGFLNESGGNIVRLELTLLGKQGKYVIQPGDILFAFRGSATSIGQVGFVEEEGDPAITVQGLCIIRCLPDTDPVWLYHYLRQFAVREQIRARATGSSLLTINLESIRDIPVEVPTDTTIKEINVEHRNLATCMASISKLQRDMRSSLRRIQNMENIEHAMRNAQTSIPGGKAH